MRDGVPCSGGEFYEIESEYSAGSDRGGDDGDAMNYPKRQADLAPEDGGNIQLTKPQKRTYHGEKITRLGAEQKVGYFVDREAIKEQKTKQQLLKDRQAETKRFFQADEKRRKRHGDGDGEEDDEEEDADDDRTDPVDQQSQEDAQLEQEMQQMRQTVGGPGGGKKRRRGRRPKRNKDKSAQA